MGTIAGAFKNTDTKKLQPKSSILNEKTFETPSAAMEHFSRQILKKNR